MCRVRERRERSTPAVCLCGSSLFVLSKCRESHDETGTHLEFVVRRRPPFHRLQRNDCHPQDVVSPSMNLRIPFMQARISWTPPTFTYLLKCCLFQPRHTIPAPLHCLPFHIQSIPAVDKISNIRPSGSRFHFPRTKAAQTLRQPRIPVPVTPPNLEQQ